MTQALLGHTALVTGASRGIGRAIAIALAEQGANVALMARTQDALQQTAASCEAHGRGALALATDVTDTEEVALGLERTKKRFGGLDIVVCNHGIHHHDPSYEGDLAAWARVIDVNLRSTMAVARLALPLLMDAPQERQRALVFMASISGKMANAGGAAYCASKHGVVGFAHAVFEDVRDHGIKVSALCPGYVNTSLVAEAVERARLDPARMIQPRDVAEAVLSVVTSRLTACPVELILRPQRAPARR